jgi:hypothetical protein
MISFRARNSTSLAMARLRICFEWGWTRRSAFCWPEEGWVRIRARLRERKDSPSIQSRSWPTSEGPSGATDLTRRPSMPLRSN